MINHFLAYQIIQQNNETKSGWVTMTLNQLDPGDVLIKTEYSSVNYKDVLAATGVGKVIKRFPCIGGIDVSGEVIESNSQNFKPGDKVLVTGYDLGVAHHGGYAEYVRVPAEWVVSLPRGITTCEAMAIGTAGFTAALSIERLEANGLQPKNGPVIVTGATGGVGSMAVDMLSTLNYKVAALTGKDNEHEYLKKLGAQEIISRHTLEMGKRPLEAAMWGGAIDALGGEYLTWLTRTVLSNGCIASCGLAGGAELNTTVMPFILRGINLLGIDSVNCVMPIRRKIWERLARELKPRHLDIIAKQISFSELPATLNGFLGRNVRGRIVIKF